MQLLQLRVSPSNLRTLLLTLASAVCIAGAGLLSIYPQTSAAQNVPSKASVQKSEAKGQTRTKKAEEKKQSSPKSSATSNTSSRQASKTVAKNKTSGGATKQSLVAKQKSARSRIAELENSVEKARERKQRLQKDLQQSSKDIAGVRQNISGILVKKNRVEKQLRNQSRQIDALQKKILEEEKIVGEINKQRLELLGYSETPDWMRNPQKESQNKTLLDLLEHQSSKAIANLNRQKKQLENVVAASRKSSQELKGIVDKEVKERDRLLKERKKRQALAYQVQKDLDAKALTLTRLKRDEQRLTTLITRIETQEKRALAAKADKFRRSSKRTAPQSAVAVRTVKPVDGKIVAKYGQKRAGKNLGNWKGLVFSVKDERPVRAVRAGRVVFADYLRGYGNMVIIDHGKGYFSVYGNNASIEKDIGDTVAAGDTISRVGSKDSDLTVLYFELRYKGKPIDPSGWLKY